MSDHVEHRKESLMKGSTRGGRRPGAGRKPKPPDELMKCISFALPPDTITEIDSEAEARAVGRSRFLREVIKEGLRIVKKKWRKPRSKKK